MKPKITYEQAEEIRRLFREGVPGKEIAHQYGVTKSTVSMIVNDKIWRQ